MYICNAFSLGMLDMAKSKMNIKIVRLSDDEAKYFARKTNLKSAIGHESTASLVSQLLGMIIPMNRIQLKLKSGDRILIFQLLSRLPEGKIIFDDDELRKISYDWFVVTIN